MGLGPMGWPTYCLACISGLRNDGDSILALCSKRVGCMESNEVVVLAILEPL